MTEGRRKGKDGELEVANLIHSHTGWDVRRRVRQHEGDSDLVGIPGWSCEVKRYAKAPRAAIAGWWAQCAAQALATGELPVLFFRANRDEWRAVWPISVGCVTQSAEMWRAYQWTAEGTVQAWVAIAREVR